jgi:type II secretory pathway component PulJ
MKLTEQKTGGFTLVELVLSISLLGIVGGIMGALFAESITSYSTMADRRSSMESARIAVERIKRDVELIASTGDIATFTDTNFTFSLAGEGSVAYTLSGTQLLRNTDVLADGVSFFDFNYLDQNGASAGTAAAIRRIQFEIQVSTEQGHGSHRVRSQVFLRSLYYESYQ